MGATWGKTNMRLSAVSRVVYPGSVYSVCSLCLALLWHESEILLHGTDCSRGRVAVAVAVAQAEPEAEKPMVVAVAVAVAMTRLRNALRHTHTSLTHTHIVYSRSFW